MDIATYTRESALNRDAYAQLREHIQDAYAGQYVALANGRVIGAASSFDAARDLVEHLDRVPEYYLVFPAHMEPDFDLIYDLSWSR
jgi:hypothetical protein